LAEQSAGLLDILALFTDNAIEYKTATGMKENMKQKIVKCLFLLATIFVGFSINAGSVIAETQTVAEARAAAAAAAAAGDGITIGELEITQGYASNIGPIISGVLSFIMAISALLVFLYLILGGVQWITSGGDKGKTEEARNKITAAVIGLIILAAAYAVLKIMLGFLGLESITGAFEEVNKIAPVTETVI